MVAAAAGLAGRQPLRPGEDGILPDSLDNRRSFREKGMSAPVQLVGSRTGPNGRRWVAGACWNGLDWRP